MSEHNLFTQTWENNYFIQTIFQKDVLKPNRENQRGIECLTISSITSIILNKQAQLSIFAEDCFCE